MKKHQSPKSSDSFFWGDKKSWVKAAKNTLNCLIGCSIGDLGTIVCFQIFWPQVHIFLVMILAMVNGIMTSIIFESVLLHIKEGLSWKKSVQMAFTMSFMSMLAMELTENTTDYILTGGQVSPSEMFYWWALLLSLLMGFLVPLPYNYYKFRKYKITCH